MVTGRLSVDYRNMLPLNTTCSVNAWFDKEEGRKLHVRAHLASIHGGAEDGAAVSEASAAAAAASTEDLHVYSESQAIFIKLSDKSMDILAANREKNRGAVLPMYSKL